MKLISVALICVYLFACMPTDQYLVYYGEAQGTTFSIKYRSSHGENFEPEIDSILELMDMLFSGYISNSQVSELNNSTKGILMDYRFKDLWEKCWELNIKSDGLFDPTLAPLFETYKKMNKDLFDSNLIFRSLENTGMQLFSIKGDSLVKKNAAARVDFDGVAQGYSVDVIRDYLLKNGISDLLVELGGEVYAIGKNDKGESWTIGIDKPVFGERELIAKIKPDGLAMATSGNYRKFREIAGKKVGHIINPKTGFPAYTNVLSVSVFSKDCYYADALATSLMNLNSDEIRTFDNDNDDIGVIIIELTNGDTTLYVSPELGDKISY